MILQRPSQARRNGVFNSLDIYVIIISFNLDLYKPDNQYLGPSKYELWYPTVLFLPNHRPYVQPNEKLLDRSREGKLF